MKKKFLAILLTTIFVFSPSISVFADTKDDKIAALQKQVDDLQKQVDDLTSKLKKYQSDDTKNNNMEDYLLKKNVLSGKRIEMAADMVGAISGFKYGDAEIYEYDMSSTQYKELVSGNAISVEGIDGYTINALAINGKYVLMGEASEDLIQAFNDYK